MKCPKCGVPMWHTLNEDWPIDADGNEYGPVDCGVWYCDGCKNAVHSWEDEYEEPTP